MYYPCNITSHDTPPTLRLTQERNTDVLQAAWDGYRKASSPLANKARASFKTLIDLQTDILNGIQSSAKTSFSSLRNVIFTVTGIILLPAIGLTFAVVKSITGPLNSLQLTIENIEKESDLTQRIPVTGKDELGCVADAINKILEKFQGIITRLPSSSGQLASSISHVSSVTQETSNAIQQQQFEVEKVATASWMHYHTRDPEWYRLLSISSWGGCVLCLFALDPVVAALPPQGFRWLLASGIFYTSGIHGVMASGIYLYLLAV